ncbi:hypothetical protein ACHAWF_013745 [Thalassiosira exigua]
MRSTMTFASAMVCVQSAYTQTATFLPDIGSSCAGSCRMQPFTSIHSQPAIKRRQRSESKAGHVFSSKGLPTSLIKEEIRYIAGRRALLLRPPASSSQKPRTPLIILGGMAQSIASWEFHLPYLARHRPVLIYEALGQGPPPPDEVCSVDGIGVTLEEYYSDVSLERQGHDFWNVVDKAFFPSQNVNDRNDAENSKVDVAGFSFGGRVAMAAAVSNPNRIRRLHLTGVGAERDELSNVILASWQDMLFPAPDDTDKVELEEECDPINHASKCTAQLRSFAWSVILATYSDQFLSAAGPERIRTWVDSVCRYNTEEGLRAILMQTHGHEGQNPWTPAAMAQRIQSTKAIESCRIVVGSQDKMAHPMQALRLAKILDTSVEKEDSIYKVMEGCGHAVPMEAMRLWRGDLLDFLNKE